jgi:hypothetical protein
MCPNSSLCCSLLEFRHKVEFMCIDTEAKLGHHKELLIVRLVKVGNKDAI